jgi:hypothetical protein
VLGAQPGQHGETLRARHFEIQQHEVGVLAVVDGRLQRLEGLRLVEADARHGRRERLLQRLPEEGMVVRDDDPRAFAHASDSR